MEEEEITPPDVSELPPPMPVFNVELNGQSSVPVSTPVIPPRKSPPITVSTDTPTKQSNGEICPPDYEIVERLGRGSFGSVYKAIHTPTGNVVALKKSPASEMEESMGEIEILRECDSPAIVKYYGNEVYEGYLWISMEYCGLGALTDVMKLNQQKKLVESEIAAICKAILIGLEYLHVTGKMHRDIKPENILMTSDGTPKLADFGVAGKFSFEDKRTTLTGTPYYIAPEILQENNPGYDAKADIWSLGICAIEFAQGEPPWYNTSPMRVMFLIAANPAPTFNDPTKYSKEFNEFVRACLIKNPQKRASSSDLLTCDFIANSKPPTEALAGLASGAAKLVEQAGGLENALKAIQNPPPNPKILGESRMRSPSAPSSPSPPVVVAQSPPKSSSPSGPLTTAQIINSSSPSVAAKPNRRSLTDALFGLNKGKDEKELKLKAEKEKKSKEKEKEKKEKKDKKDKKDKRKSEHPQLTTLSERGTIYARKSQPTTESASVDKSYLKSMLSKFFGGGRPSKDELVKKKILNALYDY